MLNKNVKISVIVSTYNRPDALLLVLSSLCRQNDDNYEIIVADDGSAQETTELIDNISMSSMRVYIHHVWHEDKGFRLARIRNLAVKKAKGEYLIFLDGDCIPPPNFIKKHRSLMERGWFVNGQRILANQYFSKKLINKEVCVLDSDFWTLKNFYTYKNNNWINRYSPVISLPIGIIRKISPYKWEKVRGCNLAMWADDYKKINGSDESFIGWGAEDTDIAVRLINNGIYLKDGRCCSYVLHLWHQCETRKLDKLKKELILLREKKKIIYPYQGMNGCD